MQIKMFALLDGHPNFKIIFSCFKAAPGQLQNLAMWNVTFKT